MRVLTPKEVSTELKSSSNWIVNKASTQLTKTYTFSDYISGLMFVARIAVKSEILQHHPSLELSYGKVKVKLTTHEVKGLTKLDLSLAKSIDEIYNRLGEK